MIFKHILQITFLNKLKLFFIFGAQLNGFTYFYLIQIILFTSNCLACEQS